MHYRHNYRHNQLDHIYRTCISSLDELTEVVNELVIKEWCPQQELNLHPIAGT